MLNFHKKRQTSMMITILLVIISLQMQCHNSSNGLPKNTAEYEDSSKNPEVSVKIVEAAKEIIYTNNDPFVIVCTNKDSTTAEYFSVSEITVKSSRTGLVVYDKNYGKLAGDLSRIYFRQTIKNGIGRVNWKGYRGQVYIVSGKKSGSLDVINKLDIDSYLKGVLPKEMGIRELEEFEALKAQAVSARTYALKKLSKSRGSRVLESTILDQVYTGYEDEYNLANKAVDNTAGEAMMYKDKLITAYYFAVCGGRTAGIDEVWGSPPQGYLVSINDENYCAWAKNYFWEDEFSKELLERRLNSYYKNKTGVGLSGTLKDIKVITREESGRINVLKIYTSLKQYEIKGDNIRWAIRKSADYSKILPSTLFDLKIGYGDYGNIETIKFVGRGNGHGIGMCQCGAIGRARQGQDYLTILSSYYNAIKIEKVY
ncbi:MAG: SpoIID/LytB domain-containing protein [candidate division Zixibacteria bacterium]|nr:SpoIID/LytB domain-containing protein [candidate division Zixibacteria bacterium]